MTRRAGSRARLSSEHSRLTLTSSLSEYGLYLPFHNGCPCADRADPDRDTVDAVGLVPRRLPFTQVNDNIKHFCHAISLDERRVWVDFFFLQRMKTSSLSITSRFKPSIWYRSKAHDRKGIQKHEMPRSKPHNHRTRAGQLEHLEHQYSESEAVTKVEEVWFAGCHCGALYISMILYGYIILTSNQNVCRYRRRFSHQRNP